MIKPFLFIVFCLTALIGMPQTRVESELGRFAVTYDKGCVPLTVDIQILDNLGDVERSFNFEQDKPIDNDAFFYPDSLTHTYLTPGSYYIGQLIDNQNRDYLRIDVYDTSEPLIDIERCDDGFLVRSTDTTYQSLRVYFSPTDSAEIHKGEYATHIISGTERQTFHVRGFHSGSPSCQLYERHFTPITTPILPTITSATLTEQCEGAFSLSAEVDAYDPLSYYEVIFEQDNSSQILHTGKLISHNLFFDSIAYSKDLLDYCIYTVKVDNCTNTRTQSTPFCEAPSALSLTPFENLYSTYTDAGVFINVDTIAAGIIEVYRSWDNQTFELQAEITSPYTDAISTLSRKHYYRLDYVDTCGHLLASANTHPPFISAQEIAANQYEITITLPSPALPTGSYIASLSTGSEIGTSSTINRLMIDEDTDISPPINVRLQAKDGVDRQYASAEILSAQGSQPYATNRLTLKYEFVVHIPDAFTPNNDGLNDTLEIYGLPSAGTLKIFNRWSQTIATVHLEPNHLGKATAWDGTINGRDAPEGTYIYEIVFELENGQKRQQKGTFVVLKN